MSFSMSSFRSLSLSLPTLVSLGDLVLIFRRVSPSLLHGVPGGGGGVQLIAKTGSWKDKTAVDACRDSWLLRLGFMSDMVAYFHQGIRQKLEACG